MRNVSIIKSILPEYSSATLVDVSAFAALFVNLYLNRPNELITMIMNISDLFDNHSTDINVTHLKCQDSHYIDDYNEKLRTEINSSTLLKECSVEFTTVPEITEGSTGFIEDGLHYSDETLGEIVEFICRH